MTARYEDPFRSTPRKPLTGPDAERRHLAAELMREHLTADTNVKKARARVRREVLRAHPVTPAGGPMPTRDKISLGVAGLGVLATIVLTIADGLLNGLFILIPTVVVASLIATTKADHAAHRAIESGIEDATRDSAPTSRRQRPTIAERRAADPNAHPKSSAQQAAQARPPRGDVRLDQFQPGHLRVAVPSDGLRTEWRTAEEIAAAALRQLGIHDAVVTQSTRDGGVDVTSSTHVAQVKHLNKKAPAEVIQKIIGAALHRGANAVVFSLGGYSQDALSYAEDMRVPLFTYDLSGTYTPVNDEALLMVYDAQHPDPDVR